MAMGRLYELIDSRLLHRARAVTAKEALAEDSQQPLKAGWATVFVFFNLESAFAMGHAILGLAEPGGPVRTFSFFRRARSVVAPAKVATIREAVTFRQIIDRDGWILHGTDDDIWWEHMTCCLALQCSQKTYREALAYFQGIAARPGTYGLLTRNCIHICRRALAAGGIRMLDGRGRPFHTVLPRRVYLKAIGARGAAPFGAWRYWFPAAPPPPNPEGHRVRPLKMPSLMAPPQSKG